MKVIPIDDRWLVGSVPWWSRAGEIVVLNLDAKHPLGYHRDELVGRHVKNVIPEVLAERLAAERRRFDARSMRRRARS